MTGSRLCYGLALGGGLAFYVFYREWLSWFVLALLLALPLLSLLLALAAARRVTLTVAARPAAAQKDEEVRFVVRAVNPGRLPVARVRFALRVRNVLGQWERPRRSAVFLGGRSGRTVEFTVRSHYAGVLQCRVEGARCCDFLGLFSCKRLAPCEARAVVMPQALPIQPVLAADPVPDWEGGQVHPGKSGEDPSETIGLRPYREGDSPRAIHWKRSGRAEGLLVREFAQPVSDAVELLLALSAAMEVQDILLDALCSLHRFLEEAGVGHRVTWFDASEHELRSRRCDSEEEWSLALGDILSAGGRRGAALALRLGGGSGPGRARVLYLCGEYGKAEQDRLCGLEDALSLAAAENGAAVAAGAVPLYRESLREDLTNLTI